MHSRAALLIGLLVLAFAGRPALADKRIAQSSPEEVTGLITGAIEQV